MNSRIRTALCAAAVLPLAVVLGGAARGPRSNAAAPGTLPTKACKTKVDAAETGKLPVVTSAADFSCLDEVATKFQTPAATIVQPFVPADPGCSSDVAAHPNATQISVTAYNNAGNLDFDQDFKKKDAIVVAKIVNNSNCPTRGIRLAAHHTYYWVVEHRGRDARLVSADDEVKLGHFSSCKSVGAAAAANESNESVAMLKAKNADPKQGQCDHQHTPGRRHFGMASNDGSSSMFHFASNRRVGQFRDEWVVWMSCSADCCFGDI